MSISLKKDERFWSVLPLEEIDSGSLTQTKNILEDSSVVRMALMADVHQGYSMPIGGVALTDGKIFPSWVGYDIGCGVSALKTSFKRSMLNPERIDKIYNDILSEIPVGFKHRDNSTAINRIEEEFVSKGTSIFRSIFAGQEKVVSGIKQVGTLGGGNHFIEIGYDENDFLWVVVHSGSRGIGHAVATHYMKLASGGEKAREGNYGFLTDSVLGQHYIKDMNACLDFALENRKIIIEEILKIIIDIFNLPCEVDIDKTLINKSHNMAEPSIANGRVYWLHRKGAASAYEGELCAIPGNMRDGTFIVEGKGNPDSLFSSSHGAGRLLGRRQAKRELDINDFTKKMIGIKANISEGTLDESPMAYKDIFKVMGYQKDLVEVKHHIRPILNVKG